VKVYVVAWYDYESSDWGPIFATRELAEDFARGIGYEVEEYEVFERAPAKIRCYYATREPNGRIASGSRLEWEYNVPQNDQVGKQTAWSSDSGAHARQLLAEKEGRA